ncbi:alpha/beta hydrolase [Nocardioides panacisoli]|uniref:alpha/beta fold hydrolase n=1 Tax=Nocardioides panacisoli TaxID=627624 RepID=UPI001C625629|nr:alpha/beta hydrolase [Nocardioides panacisoli]QYJ04266.1 alpha/beta hydrolase [Nocardioides panacisoli]
MPATPRLLLLPGAWMGSWIWEPTVERLRSRGVGADTLTLRGLEADPPPDTGAITLADHVTQVLDVLGAGDTPVTLVSHSYSGVVAAQVADRAPALVDGVVHVGGFLPRDGRSLLDDWGDSRAAREQEADDIAAAGNLWPAPTDEVLRTVPDLTAEDRRHLTRGFRDHPGSTVLDPARMTRPVAEQPTTYVALSPHGHEDAWATAPAPARDADAWRRRTLTSGHWPMVSQPDAVADLLTTEAHHYAAQAG